MDEGKRDGVRLLATLLRLAEKLDRSRGRFIAAARLVPAARGGVELLLEARGDVQLEEWGIASEVPVFERAFKQSLRVRVSPADQTAGGDAP